MKGEENENKEENNDCNECSVNNGKWTTKSRDYINSPSKIVKGNYYDKNVKWFNNQATQRIQNGIILDDVPW